jgi:hypothetical protein
MVGYSTQSKAKARKINNCMSQEVTGNFYDMNTMFLHVEKIKSESRHGSKNIKEQI